MTARDLAASDTWGITGPHFLGLFVVLTIVATAFAAVALHRLGGGARRPTAARILTPVEAGLLGGGDRLALTVALTELRQRELIDARCRTVGVEKPSAELDPLTRAVHTALVANGGRSRVSTRRLAERAAVASALDELRAELHDAGLLTARRTGAGIVTALLPLLAVVALGIARVLAGIGNDKPVGFLVVLIAVSVGLVALLARIAATPRATVVGRLTLRRLRAENEHLAPRHQPAWTTYGGSAVVMSAALFGGLTLTMADPAFADSFDARAAMPSGSFGSGSTGGSAGSSCGGGLESSMDIQFLSLLNE